jgi:hypothetical protein
MTIPVLTFLNNKGGVGKTSLVYHLAWMLSEIGYKVLACDLDPQANLSSAFLDEERMETLLNGNGDSAGAGATIFKCVEPLLKVGDVLSPYVQKISSNLNLIPGDLSLSGFEDTLSAQWPKALGSENLYRPFRILTAFWKVMQDGAEDMGATVILADVGPTLELWRENWKKMQENWQYFEFPSPKDKFPLPEGNMEPLGYIVQQHSVRLNRPVKAYDKWVNRMPMEYAKNLLAQKNAPFPKSPGQDKRCLATIKHYRSLVPMAQEKRKPIFHLTPADGAIGSHAAAVNNARKDFKTLAKLIIERAGLT